ncbi:MAG: leucine-rich repeat domain-containing protein [Candidatus Obscuribacterales bacterium]|nr:leucine-rich repeat domain-containing protein [Candidatus Obscuribacterales bacterium]
MSQISKVTLVATVELAVHEPGVLLIRQWPELTELTVPAGIHTVKISRANNLTQLVLTSEVTNITLEGVSLTELTLPEGVINAKLYDCRQLAKLTVPKSLVSLEVSGGNNLTELNLPVDSNLATLDLSSVDVDSIIVPPTVKTLKIGGFKKLRELKVPQGVETLYVSYNNLIEELIVPDSVVHLTVRDVTTDLKKSHGLKRLVLAGVVPHLEVYSCHRLTEITLRPGSRHVQIEGCPEIKSLEVPEGVEVLKLDSNKLQSLKVPSSVRNLSVFFCTSLKRLELPHGIQEANLSYSGVTDVTVQDGSSIKKLDLRYCSDLPKLTVPGKTGIDELDLVATRLREYNHGARVLPVLELAPGCYHRLAAQP